jgi:solute carrier family 25 iron transporter 28/37
MMAPETKEIHIPVPNILTPEEVDYEALPEDATVLAQCTAGAFAGVLEHTVMYPVDALKTRMQAMTWSSRGGIFNSIYKISSQEGWLSLWRGTSSVILGAGPAHAVYFGTYEYVKKALVKDNDHHPVKIAMAGASATITSEALMNPFDVIKQRMQLNRSGNSEFFNTVRQVVKNEGFKALYYSYPTTIAMTIPFTAMNFVVYESATKFLNPEGTHDPLKHCVSGGLAGGIAAALTTPLDCVKTVLQTRTGVNDLRIRQVHTFWDAAKLMYEVEGGRAFWKGMKPRVVSNVPATAICWTAYEMAKYYLIK